MYNLLLNACQAATCSAGMPVVESNLMKSNERTVHQIWTMVPVYLPLFARPYSTRL